MNALPPSSPQRAAGFADLPFGGQFSIWALRLWVQADRACPALHQTLRSAFVLIRMPQAYPALDQFLSIVAHGRGGRLDVNDPNTRDLSPDERFLLTVLADQQRGAAVSAYRLLLIWVSATHVQPAMAASIAYADQLSGKNLATLHEKGALEVHNTSFKHQPPRTPEHSH